MVYRRPERNRGQDRSGESETRPLKVLANVHVLGEEGNSVPFARHEGATGFGREDFRLVVKELAHKAEVGRYKAAALFDVLKGLLQAEQFGLHEVGHTYGRRPRDASLAMD